MQNQRERQIQHKLTRNNNKFRPNLQPSMVFSPRNHTRSSSNRRHSQWGKTTPCAGKKKQIPAPNDRSNPCPTERRQVRAHTLHRSANLSSVEAAVAEALSVTPDPDPELVDGLATPSMSLLPSTPPIQCPRPLPRPDQALRRPEGRRRRSSVRVAVATVDGGRKTETAAAVGMRAKKAFRTQVTRADFLYPR